MKKTAVVTGGCGFIGSHVVRLLLDDGYKVKVIDNLSAGKKENVPDNVEVHVIDVRDLEAVTSVIKQGDVIFHLAALTSVPGSIEEPLAYAHVNILGVSTILEAARRQGALGVVFSSSASIYGNQEGEMTESHEARPASPYALQKHIGERLCEMYSELYNLPTVRLRYFNVYGKGNHETGSYAPVTARFLKAKKDGRPLPIVGDGKQTRDFIHVEDVAFANIKSIDLLNRKESLVINISSGESTSVLEVANIVGGQKEWLPPRDEIRHSKGSTKLAKEKLGLIPRRLRDELIRLLQS